MEEVSLETFQQLNPRSLAINPWFPPYTQQPPSGCLGLCNGAFHVWMNHLSSYMSSRPTVCLIPAKPRCLSPASWQEARSLA